VRLLPARQRRAGVVDRPLVGVLVTDLLLDKIQYQLLPLRGVQLARQGDFDLAVGRAVRLLVAVGGGPEQGGFVFGPCGQIAVPGRFQVFVTIPLGVVGVVSENGSQSTLSGWHGRLARKRWFSRCINEKAGNTSAGLAHVVLENRSRNSPLNVPSFENRQDAFSRGYRPAQSRILAGLLIPKRTLQSEF
jgi:hypothetical protein